MLLASMTHARLGGVIYAVCLLYFEAILQDNGFAYTNR